MKRYNSLQEMIDDHAPSFVIEQTRALCESTGRDVAGMYDRGIGPAPHEPKIGENFEYWYGGTINIVEAVDDLKEITALGVGADGELCDTTLYNSAVSSDQAFYFPGREWAMWWLATNNNGGDSYFIPQSVIKAVPGNTIEESIKLTNDGKLVEENWVRDQD